MTNQKSNKAIHISLWVAQALLGAMFLMAGSMKATQAIEVLAESLPWATTMPLALVRFIGISEFLGGLGMLLPSLLRIKPDLTVWAGYGLAAVMVLAAIFHATRGEFPAIGVNLLIAAIALFVSWGRTKKAPITAKS